MRSDAFKIDACRADAILNERTALLASRPRADRVSDGRYINVAAISANGERFAFPMSMLAGVTAIRPKAWLPIKDSAVLGAIYERGNIWTVFDLAVIASGQAAASDGGKILLLRHGEEKAAVLVDEEIVIIRLDRASASPAGAERNNVSSIVRLVFPDGLMLVDEDAVWRRFHSIKRRPA